MMAWLHDRGELGLGEVFTHRKVVKENKSHFYNSNQSKLFFFYRSVLGTEFRGELEDTVMITEVGLIKTET